MAEEARLESVYTPKAYPGFESPSLRIHPSKDGLTPKSVLAVFFMPPEKEGNWRTNSGNRADANPLASDSLAESHKNFLSPCNSAN